MKKTLKQIILSSTLAVFALGFYGCANQEPTYYKYDPVKKKYIHSKTPFNDTHRITPQEWAEIGITPERILKINPQEAERKVTYYSKKFAEAVSDPNSYEKMLEYSLKNKIEQGKK